MKKLLNKAKACIIENKSMYEAFAWFWGAWVLLGVFFSTIYHVLK